MVAPDANPLMLEMFRERDRRPGHEVLYFSGEFAGKYLTGAVEMLRVTGNAQLRAYLELFVTELLDCQDRDGYLGPFPRSVRLKNRLPPGETNLLNGQTWDTWGHYHLMLGLLAWHAETADTRALRAARKMADLLCDMYLDAPVGSRLVDSGAQDPYGWTGTQMNLAPIHSLALLFNKTGEPRYIALARQIADEFAAQGREGPLAGDYIRTALAGVEFFQTPRPRWESLHPVLGIAELYRITGDESYRRAFEHIWWSIARLDRHNNGAFSTGEAAVGNPYADGPIETCCTIAWMALSVEMLRLTGSPIVADELELSTLNAVLGLYSPTGRWTTYNTPMDGERRGFVQDINWQSRPGSPELNCCSANAPRGLGLLSEWALMTENDSLMVNYYGPGTMQTTPGTWPPVKLSQTTDYPRGGRIRLAVDPARSSAFALRLRIPQWSARTRVHVNGNRVPDVNPGTYLALERKWRRGDAVEIELDMSLHAWRGERECVGKSSLYRGPLLLAYDARYNEAEPSNMPPLNAEGQRGRVVAFKRRFPPLLLLALKDVAGRSVRLCDFASAGATGTPYRSWLDLTGGRPSPFCR
jgi:DUF1680 family protein